MEWPELMKWNDRGSFIVVLEDTLGILDNRIQHYKSLLNKKNKLQEAKDQLRKNVEEKTENIRRLEAKVTPVEQKIEKARERISQTDDEISEFMIELEDLKSKNLSLEKEVEAFRKELRKKNEIHLKAIEHYKRKLHLQLEMDDNEKLTLHFSDIKASLTLSCAEDGVYKLIATEPELECFNQLVEMLESSHDVSGCIAHTRTLLQKKHKQLIRETN